MVPAAGLLKAIGSIGSEKFREPVPAYSEWEPGTDNYGNRIGNR
jgi:hypothetical protein